MWSLSALGFLIMVVSAVLLSDLAPKTHHEVVYLDSFHRAVSQEITFQPEGSAVHGWTEDGCDFSGTGWQSTDGVGVSLMIYYCKTPAKAQRVLNKLAKETTKVFEKKTLTSKDGKKTGERIVATSSEDFIKRPQMILWSDKDEIYVVESTSFPHALAFEKKWPNM